VRAVSAMSKSWNLAKNLHRAEAWTELGKSISQSASAFKAAPLRSTAEAFTLSAANQKRLAAIWHPFAANSTFARGFTQGQHEAWRFYWMMKGIGAGSIVAGQSLKFGTAALQGDTIDGTELQQLKDQIFETLVGGNGIGDLAMMNGIIRGGDAMAKMATNSARYLFRNPLRAGSILPRVDAMKYERIMQDPVRAKRLMDHLAQSGNRGAAREYLAKLEQLQATRLAKSADRIRQYEQAGAKFASEGNHYMKSVYDKLIVTESNLAKDLTKAYTTKELTFGNLVGNIPTSIYFNTQSWQMVVDQHKRIDGEIENLKKLAARERARGNETAAKKMEQEIEHKGKERLRAWASFVVDVGVDLFFTSKFLHHETWAVSAYKPKAKTHERHMNTVVEEYIKRQGLVREANGSIEMSPEQYRTLSRIINTENKKFTKDIDAFITDQPMDAGVANMRGTTYVPFTVYDESPALSNLGLIRIYPGETGWLAPNTSQPAN